MQRFWGLLFERGSGGCNEETEKGFKSNEKSEEAPPPPPLPRKNQPSCMKLEPAETSVWKHAEDDDVEAGGKKEGRS